MRNRLFLLSLLILMFGCSLISNRPFDRPCLEPCPTPPPSTTTTTVTLPPITFPPITRPPHPVPTPTPDNCNYRYDPASHCPEGGNGSYYNTLNQTMSKVTGCNISSDCTVNNWHSTLVAIMEELNRNGYCSSYDLSGDNPGSEMGLRRNADNFTEYYQPITTAYKIRWADVRSICTPVWDSSPVQDVKNYQGKK